MFQVNDISYILNVSTTCPQPPFIQEGHFFRIPVNDNYSAKMLPFFDEAFQFIGNINLKVKQFLYDHKKIGCHILVSRHCHPLKTFGFCTITLV